MDGRRARPLRRHCAGGCGNPPGGGSRQATHPVLGGLGPGQRACRARQGLHQGERHRDEVRVRPLDELCRPLPQRAQFARQAVRPDHRRQPMDRRRGGEQVVRQAQRLLRQRAHLHGRLRAGDRARLFAVAEEHAELLGAAGDGRRRRLDLPQGLVLASGDPGRVQEEVRPRSRAAQDLRRAQADRRILPGPRDRRQEGVRRLHLHRARLGRHHDGRHQRPVQLRLRVRQSEEALSDGRASSTRPMRSRGSSSTRRSTSAAPPRA